MRTINHRPRKRFGQNFLKDPTVINNIIASLNVGQSDFFVEIGPGLGALTFPLLNILPELTAVEIDRDLSRKLAENCPQDKKLNLYTEDALQFNLALLQQEHAKNQEIRLIGNLPYNISTPLLFHFFQYVDCIQDMHFMFQKEVVDRLIAQPNQKAYGRLGILAQYYCHIEPVCNVSPEAFYPKPAVQSSVVRLTPHKEIPLPAQNIILFQSLVRVAFNQRRKTLRKILKSYLNNEDYIALNIDPSLRPEALSITNFIEMSNFIHQHKTLPPEGMQ